MTGKPLHRRTVAGATFLLAVVVVVSVLGATAPAAAAATNHSNISNVSPYYDDSNASIQNSSWTHNRTNATLANVSSYAVGIGSYIFGTGTAAGGGGEAGTMLTGLAVAGVFVGAVAGTGVGFVGGGVAAVATGFGLTELGLAPGWFRFLLLLGVGLIVGTVYLRSVR